jgi:hypothetical protein
MSDASTSLPQVAQANHFKGLLRHGFAAHGLFFVTALFYLLALAVSYLLFPPPTRTASVEVLAAVATSAVPIALLAVILREFFLMVRTERPASPSKRLVQRVAAVLKDRHRMASGLPMFLAFALFMFVFTAFKGQITATAPFAWDQAFDELDMALHSGVRPWELLHPMLSSGLVMFLINLNYNGWFMVMNLFLVHFAFYAPPGEERTRFFLTFIALWMVGGTLLATLFSSAGPCYFAELGLGSEAYGPLMQRLRYINEHWPIWAIGTQEMLWSLKAQGSALGGVSAMPSMHNATVLLFIFAVWAKGGTLRLLVVAHGVLIFFGSIMLGWHYAVDAYLAFALTIVFWLASKPVARWWHDRPAVSAFDCLIASRGGP